MLPRFLQPAIYSLTFGHMKHASGGRGFNQQPTAARDTDLGYATFLNYIHFSLAYVYLRDKGILVGCGFSEIRTSFHYRVLKTGVHRNMIFYPDPYSSIA